MRSLSVRAGLLVPVLVVALLLAVCLAVAIGSVSLPVSQVGGILVEPVLPWLIESDWTRVRAAIVWESRMPRVATAVVVGAALAVAGALAQTVTTNPMADPYLLGVSQGAGLAVSILTVFGLGAGLAGYATTPVAAFLGGLLALTAVFAVAGRFGSVTALILGGLAVGQIASALMTMVLYTAKNSDHVTQVMFWMTGGLGSARWELLAAPAAVLVVGLIAAVAMGRWLDLLHAGDDAAAASGVDARTLRVLSLLGVSLVAGTAVAISGGIGFVGLLVPHAARFLVGGSARKLLVTSALLGAVFLVLADLAARTVVAPSELPVGVLTALVGGPVFLVMLAQRRHT